MKLTDTLVALLFVGSSAFAAQTDFPGTSWPKDLTCRQHDDNSGSGIFPTREVVVRFHTPNDAEATIKFGMIYYQPISLCYTDLNKGFLLVKPVDGVPSDYSLTGTAQCLPLHSSGGSTQSKSISMEVDLAKMKLYYSKVAYTCRWEEFWN